MGGYPWIAVPARRFGTKQACLVPRDGCAGRTFPGDEEVTQLSDLLRPRDPPLRVHSYESWNPIRRLIQIRGLRPLIDGMQAPRVTRKRVLSHV